MVSCTQTAFCVFHHLEDCRVENPQGLLHSNANVYKGIQQLWDQNVRPTNSPQPQPRCRMWTYAEILGAAEDPHTPIKMERAPASLHLEARA